MPLPLPSLAPLVPLRVTIQPYCFVLYIDGGLVAAAGKRYSKNVVLVGIHKALVGSEVYGICI